MERKGAEGGMLRESKVPRVWYGGVKRRDRRGKCGPSERKECEM